MARSKDCNWTLPDGDHTYDSASLAVLMDIRDDQKLVLGQLQVLNRLLACPNFIEIPHILRGIRKKLPTSKKV